MTCSQAAAPSAQPEAAPLALRVLVIDDERAVREGLRRLITFGMASPISVRVAGSVAQALNETRAFRPHVAVLDLDLAGEDGLALLPSLVPTSRVLVLTSHGDAVTCAQALALGAGAFVEKQEPASTLLAQLHALAAATGCAPSSD